MDASAERIDLSRAEPITLGPLFIDPATRRVAREDGREEFLEPRVMQVLVALARAPGRILSRDDLLASCWRGVVVGDDALNRVIGRLRRLEAGLGQGAFEVETVPRVGYRVRAPQGGAKPPAAEPVRTERRASIVVLPFANMSDDPQQAYFSDGITEDIITDLSKLSSLFVVARTTSFAHREVTAELPQLARRLNVSHVLEGSVRKAGGQVRITAQLIDGETGGHVWAERYDRGLSDIFAVQDEISQAIVRALRLTLRAEEKSAIERRATLSAEAWDLYRMARRYFVGGEGDRRALEAVVRLCRRATELDPSYAEAWALLSFGQSALQAVFAGPIDTGLEAADVAVRIDPELAEAHAARAIGLQQEDRSGEALAEAEIALALDPDSWTTNNAAARLYYLDRRFDLAIRHWEKALTLPESRKTDAGLLMSCYHAIGDDAGLRRVARIALERAEEALAQDHVNGGAIGCGVTALAALGEHDRARDMMRRALLTDPDNPRMRYNFACGAIVQLNDPEAALDLLEPAFSRTTVSWLAHMERDPDLDPIRDHPRFLAMIAAARAHLAATSPAPAASAPE